MTGQAFLGLCEHEPGWIKYIINIHSPMILMISSIKRCWYSFKAIRKYIANISILHRYRIFRITKLQNNKAKFHQVILKSKKNWLK